MGTELQERMWPKSLRSGGQKSDPGVKPLAARPDDLSLIYRTHGKRETSPENSPLMFTCSPWYVHILPCRPTQNK